MYRILDSVADLLNWRFLLHLMLMNNLEYLRHNTFITAPPPIRLRALRELEL